MQIIVNNDNANTRIDNFLSKELGISRTKIANQIKEENILVNSNIVKSSYSVKTDDVIDVDIEEEATDILAEEMDLDIVYEDDDVIVLNKANGVVVHPAVGNNHGTLVNGLMFHSKNLSSLNGEFRPGIVHRIDANTTGLLMVAKNDYAHEFLAKQLEAKTTHRVYNALVWGEIKNQTGTIEATIGRDVKDRKKMAVTDQNAKSAVTHFTVLERYKEATLLELKLETGRTHQIRVHLNYIGHPVVNDPVYSNKKVIDNTGQCLHAKELGFIHPRTKEYMQFSSELPECFTNILKLFKSE